MVYRIGVIGCGAIAQMMHLPYISEMPNLALIALCDLSDNVLQGCAHRYGLPSGSCYTDYQEMLAQERLDLVVISSLDHYAPSLAASRAGVSQFIEKPIAFNARQAKEMIQVANENDVFQIIGFMKRYDPNFEHFQKAVSQMTDIVHVHVRNFGGNMTIANELFSLLSANDISKSVQQKAQADMNDSLREVVGENQALYSAYYNLLMGATHDFSLIRAMFGEPERIHSFVVSASTVAVMEYSEATFVYEGGWLDKRTVWDEAITVYSLNQRISINFPWPYLKNAPSIISLNENLSDGTNVQKEIIHSFDEAYRREWLHITQCLAGTESPRTTAIDACKDLVLFERMITKFNT